MSEKMLNTMCGLLGIGVEDSNLNGDPDANGEPRIDPKGFGVCSGVSIKRKVRDVVMEKDGPVWQYIERKLGVNPEECGIFEDPNVAWDYLSELNQDGLLPKKFWDVRMFGVAFLDQKGKNGESRKRSYCGGMQISFGRSLRPIEIETMTNTRRRGSEPDKNSGMAPNGFSYIPHGLYVVRYYVNPTLAKKIGCTRQDIEIFLHAVPYMFSHTMSRTRVGVKLLSAWHVESNSPLGSRKAEDLMESLAPYSKEKGVTTPSTSFDDYVFPEPPPTLPSEVCEVRNLLDC